jgi:spore coat polysaccharide biosynthesis protein SpsF
MKANCVAIVQARMGSRRLPEKVMADILGRPMLERVLVRVGRAVSPSEVVVATSTGREDDPIEALCARLDVPCSRGSAEDVLDRFHQAAAERQADTVVRITADCPLIDPELVDETVRAFQQASPEVDFACNRLPWDRTYPIGTDTEVCSRQALDAAWREADQPNQREHVMPYFYENPERFRVLHVRSEDSSLGKMRWTVDEADDLAFVREIYARFGRDDFTWRDVIDLLRREPGLARINVDVPHKSHKHVG